MELYELTCHELKEKLDRKEISSREITQAFLKRIEQVEDQIKAFVTITGDLALEQAEQYDAGSPFRDWEDYPMG